MLFFPRFLLLSSLLAAASVAQAQTPEPPQATQQASIAQRPDSAKAKAIRITCASTRTPKTEPLCVVNGVPASSFEDIKNLNPNDITEIVVVKGAEATALYGTRGANGVILITTSKAYRKAQKKAGH
ncbi:TonB-dependent receptor plug domain-containing protein [Hymenobacter weizhouensis]|uniref:TonB-dependent receptor plug domain-containing protein n=1 Tax=Hymenobacter sp. YIM 151500-1 TaxID=2987689 RepID=UPI002226436B|nr:TonB-dependent receptor plug domain-containing protein [Hymenobacter sp. YIM 151500-1]UYZ64302.1 TonB-dependent receptor plug domain-containing protein [Hymenobacter sp. YIM 151500-1]